MERIFSWISQRSSVAWKRNTSSASIFNALVGLTPEISGNVSILFSPSNRRLSAARYFKFGETILENMDPVVCSSHLISKSDKNLDARTCEICSQIPDNCGILQCKANQKLQLEYSRCENLLHPQSKFHHKSSRQFKKGYDNLIWKVAIKCCHEISLGYHNTMYLLCALASPDMKSLNQNATDNEFLKHLQHSSEELLESLALAGYAKESIAFIDKQGQWYGQAWGVLSLNSIRVPGTGTALYSLPSLINHSCHPSCEVSFNGTLLKLTAARELQSGEELLINYVAGMSSQWTNEQEKMKYLMFNYGIECSVSCACKSVVTTSQTN